MTEQFYFTSYAHADQKFVDKLTAKLERSDIAIWKDVKAISPGEPWDIAIERAIQ